MAAEAVQEYVSTLQDLKMNSKPYISMLTMLAEENIAHAAAIVQAVENHLRQVRPEVKLPVLYVIDSIVKNVGKDYLTYFSRNIADTFCNVFREVDEKTRGCMYKLRHTWDGVFPEQKLYAIDTKVKEIDPAWPVTARLPSVPASTNIHINPRVFKSGTLNPDTTNSKLEEEYQKKQKELMELQTKKLELEILQLKETLEKGKQVRAGEDPEDLKILEEYQQKQRELLELKKHKLELELQQMKLAIEKAQDAQKQIQSTSAPPMAAIIPVVKTKTEEPPVIPQTVIPPRVPVVVSQVETKDKKVVPAAEPTKRFHRDPRMKQFPENSSSSTVLAKIDVKTSNKDPRLKGKISETRSSNLRDPRFTRIAHNAEVVQPPLSTDFGKTRREESSAEEPTASFSPVFPSSPTLSKPPKESPFKARAQVIATQNTENVLPLPPRSESPKPETVNPSKSSTLKLKTSPDIKNNLNKEKKVKPYTPSTTEEEHTNASKVPASPEKEASSKKKSASKSEKKALTKSILEKVKAKESQPSSERSHKNHKLKESVDKKGSIESKRRSKESNKAEERKDKPITRSTITAASRSVEKKDQQPDRIFKDVRSSKNRSYKVRSTSPDSSSVDSSPLPALTTTRLPEGGLKSTTIDEDLRRPPEKIARLVAPIKEGASSHSRSRSPVQDVGKVENVGIKEHDVPTSEDIDLRQMALAGVKRQSTDSNDGPQSKKSKGELFSDLFGPEDKDMRHLPNTLTTSPSVSGGTESSTTPVTPGGQANITDTSSSEPSNSPSINQLTLTKSWAKFKQGTRSSHESPGRMSWDRTPPPASPAPPRLGQNGRGQSFDRLGRPLLYHKLPDDPGARRLSLCQGRPDSANSNKDICSLSTGDDANISLIVSQADQQLKEGMLTLPQYNKLLKEVIHMSELHKLREAQRQELHEANKGDWDDSQDWPADQGSPDQGYEQTDLQCRGLDEASPLAHNEGDMGLQGEKQSFSPRKDGPRVAKEINAQGLSPLADEDFSHTCGDVDERIPAAHSHRIPPPPTMMQGSLRTLPPQDSLGPVSQGPPGPLGIPPPRLQGPPGIQTPLAHPGQLPVRLSGPPNLHGPPLSMPSMPGPHMLRHPPPMPLGPHGSQHHEHPTAQGHLRQHGSPGQHQNGSPGPQIHLGPPGQRGSPGPHIHLGPPGQRGSPGPQIQHGPPGPQIQHGPPGAHIPHGPPGPQLPHGPPELHHDPSMHHSQWKQEFPSRQGPYPPRDSVMPPQRFPVLGPQRRPPPHEKQPPYGRRGTPGSWPREPPGPRQHPDFEAFDNESEMDPRERIPHGPVHEEVPPPDMTLVKRIVKNKVKNINIDGIPREIRFYKNTAIVMMSWDDPRELSFQPGIRTVVIDEVYRVDCKFGEVKECRVDGQSHLFRLGAPTREIYVNGAWYECYFGGPPIEIDLNGKLHKIRLEGPPPTVKIGDIKRIDLVAGRINLIVNAKEIFPIFLDRENQQFEIGGVPVVFQFIDQLKRVILNGKVFKVKFGGLPIPILLQGTKHFIRFSELPSGITPGKVDIVGMPESGLPDSPPLQFIKDQLYRNTPPPVLPDHRSSSHKRPERPPRRNLRSHRPESPTKRDSSRRRTPPRRRNVQPAPSILDNKSEVALVPSNRMELLPASHVPDSGFSYQVQEDSQPLPAAASTSSTKETKPKGPVNVSELLQKLIATGLLPGKSESPSLEAAAGEKKDEPEVLPKMDFTNESLKTRHPVFIKHLYSGIQCSSCGVRFPPEQTMKYSQHLDWHFRQNRRERDSVKKAQSRRWYYDVSDWIQFEEIEDLEERAQSWFDTQQAEAQVEQEEVQSVPASNNSEDNLCGVCQDGFVQFYNHDTEEWHLRDAVQDDGKTYHPICLEDHKTNLARVLAEESATNEMEESKEEPMETSVELDLTKDGEEDKVEVVDEIMAVDDADVKQEPGVPEEREWKPEMGIPLIKQEETEEKEMPKEEKEMPKEDSNDVVVYDPNIVIKQEPKEKEKEVEIIAMVPEGWEFVRIKEEPKDEEEDADIVSVQVVEKEIPHIDIEEDAEPSGGPDAEIETPTSVVPDTTVNLVASSIDGNVELSNDSQLTLPPPTRIKINISKPSVAMQPPAVIQRTESSQSEASVTEPEANDKETGEIQTPAPVHTPPPVCTPPPITSLDPNEPPPPGEEDLATLGLRKPGLVGKTLDEYPPVHRGVEMSGLCSIM